MLLHEAVAWAWRHNARSVQLGVACGDTSAVRLYTRAGFKVVVGAPEPLRPGLRTSRSIHAALAQ